MVADLTHRLRAVSPKDSGYAEISREAADEIVKLRDRIAALEAELAAARKDAERYRWLRNHAEGQFMLTTNFKLKDSEEVDEYTHQWFGKMDGSYVDKAIDAALGKGEAG